MKHGEIARNLDRLYEYFQHLLIKANVRKDSAPIDECLGHLEEMRNTWREAFSKVETERAPTDAPPRHNQHGSTLMNLQG
jgi:flagellar protein FliS